MNTRFSATESNTGNFATMKLVIVLACLMVVAAAVEEMEVLTDEADLDVAEHHKGGYYGGYHRGYGGYWGGYRRGYGGYGGHYGWGRKRRSVEEDALVTDLDVAEHHRRGWGYGGYGGYGGRGYDSGYRGYGGYKGYGSNGGYHG